MRGRLRGLGASGLRGNQSRRCWSIRGKSRLVGGVAFVACLLGVPASAAAKITASIGFSPSRNGFSFANYGNGYSNLSANEMRALFGTGVCAFVNKSKGCVLTPVAKRYMDDANRGMAGGHCFGFSALSLLLFRHRFPPLATKPVDRLRLPGDTQLQHAIAYTFQWQTLPALQNAWVRGSPNDVLRFLTNALRHGDAQLYTMAIFRPGFEGGHAITPYAVDSRGGGRYDVLVYDNNWPGQVRRVHFDTHANTWSYVAAANPSVPDSTYTGNAKTGTLNLIPATPGLGVHFCPFCDQADGRPTYNQLSLEGNPYNHAHLLIRDPQGRALGYVGGKLVSQIPNARAMFSTAFSDSQERQEPLYRIPFGINVEVTVDGSGLRYPDTEHFSLIGQNHDLAVDGIVVGPGERESIALNGDEESMTYTSAGSQLPESPLFSVGLVRRAGDYSIGIQALAYRSDSVINISDDRATSTLSIHDASASGETFELRLTQEVSGKVKNLRTVRIDQPAGKTVDLLYGTVPKGQSRIQVN